MVGVLNINVFLLSVKMFRSKDDPFLLYAAMYSGIHTQILTRDLMRGHKFLLNNSELKNIFQKWLQKNRLLLQIRPQDKIIIKVSLLNILNIIIVCTCF